MYRLVTIILLLLFVQSANCQYRLAEPISTSSKEVAYELFILRQETTSIDGPLVVCAGAIMDIDKLLHGRLARDLNLDNCRQTSRYQADCIWKELSSSKDQRKSALDIVCHGLKSGENYFWGFKYSINFYLDDGNNIIHHGICKTDSDTVYFSDDFICSGDDDNFTNCTYYNNDNNKNTTSATIRDICIDEFSGDYFPLQ